jgi:penicillin-binding protein 1C
MLKLKSDKFICRFTKAKIESDLKINILNFISNLRAYLINCSKRKLFLALFFLFSIILYWFSLPVKLFNDQCSTVIYASNNELLGAMIAADGQWRFPEIEKVPVKFEKCICQFEDRHFYEHPGFNPFSFIRAMRVNIKRGKIVQGGSTLTMQTVRLSRKNKSRTVFEKIIEIVLSTRVEIRYSKNEILRLFATNAPFGSNVVGLDAAAWRYFGRSPKQLSWAEMATLAVLPNAPSLIFPGKNRDLLLAKRNYLLDRLYLSGNIDKNTWQLSKLENLPSKPYPLPQLAPHLLTRIYNSPERNKIVKTTLDIDLQIKVNEIIENHVIKLKSNGIYNAAALVADVETGNILAYIGNAPKLNNEDHQNDVDIIISPRSTGSILKPILYAASLDAGEILPYTMIPDIPVMLSGYSPKNYNRTYEGAVHANRALSRSLNIPAVYMLKEYKVDRFYGLLKRLGITTLDFPADRYGLSLILGGAEGSLWDIAGIYSDFARIVNHFSQNSGLYDLGDIRQLNYINISIIPETDNFKKIKGNKRYRPILLKKGIIDAASIWLTFKALL